MKSVQLHRRCACGILNGVSILIPANGHGATKDEFTCKCGARFDVHSLWTLGAETLTQMVEVETTNPDC